MSKGLQLQHQVESLRSECEEMEEKHVIQTQKLREEMRALHNKHKQEAATIEASHKVSLYACLLYTSPSPRDATLSRMPSSA